MSVGQQWRRKISTKKFIERYKKKNHENSRWQDRYS